MKSSLILVFSSVLIAILFSGCFGFHYHGGANEDHPSGHHG